MGDGVKGEADDDGVVGINSQQVGIRLNYRERLFLRGQVTPDEEFGSVSAVNTPTFEQATSSGSVLHQDHLDVIGVGPDTFNELAFYAALIDTMARTRQALAGRALAAG